MGTFASTPPFGNEPNDDDSEEEQRRLGDFLAGRLADLDIDSVEEVRSVREDE